MRCEFLWNAAASSPKGAMPVLSFPATQKLGVNVYELVHDAQLQAQAMEYVAKNTPTVASVSLMDLSVEAEAFGAQVRFSEDEVPNVIGQLIVDENDAKNLKVPPVGAGRTGLCVEAVRLAKQRITDKPVLAGVIGPYSLAGRLMDVTEIMYACYDEPELVHLVLEKCTEFLLAYCDALKATGCDGVVMAEPLAGLMSAEMADEFSCTYVKKIIDRVQDDNFVLVYHNCGNAVGAMLPELFAMKAGAYHFGNAVNMAEILEKAPADALCMGNIDPSSKFTNGTVEEMQRAVTELMAACGSYPNFIPSSGCDIPASAKWENIDAFFAG